MSLPGPSVEAPVGVIAAVRRRRAGRLAAALSSCSASSIPAVISGEVGQRLVVGEQPEVHAAVVGHDRHGERVVLGQEGDREQLGQPAPEQVERELRAGHVGDDQVEQARGEVQPRRLGEDRRRRELLHRGQHLGADRLLGLLQAVHRGLDEAQPRDRVVDVDRQRRAHHRDAVAELHRARPGRGSRPARARASRGPAVRTPRVLSQRASAPETTVRTTSLTVPPSAFLTAL